MYVYFYFFIYFFYYKDLRIAVARSTGRSWGLPQCQRNRAVTYSEAKTYTYDVISTFHDPCYRRHWRRWRRKERPRRGPPVWMKGLRLSLRWFGEKPPVPRSSDVAVVLAIPRKAGVMTSPSPEPGVGRGPPPCGRREGALWPTSTAVWQQLKMWKFQVLTIFRCL